MNASVYTYSCNYISRCYQLTLYFTDCMLIHPPSDASVYKNSSTKVHLPPFLLNFYQPRGRRFLSFFVVAIFVWIDENKPGCFYRCQDRSGQGQSTEIRYRDRISCHTGITGCVVAIVRVHVFICCFRRFLSSTS